MLVVILSSTLDILFVSLDGTAPFRPEPALLGGPVAKAAPLITADPELVRDCRDLLDGKPVVPHTLGQDATPYVRRLSLRQGPEPARDEIIVTYEPGPATAKAELARLRNQMAEAMEAQEDAVAYFDSHDRLTLCNRVYANLQPGPEGPVTPGMTFVEILRRNLRHGALDLPPEQHESWIAQRMALRTKPYLTMELGFQDNRVYRLIERKTLDDGRMILMVDISDLKRMEKRLHDVVRATNIGTWSQDLDTGVVTLDDRARAMLGYGDAGDASLALTPAQWRAMVHPDDTARVEHRMRACILRNINHFQVEYRAQHKDGHWVWLQCRGGISRHHPDGRPRVFSGIQLDITRQKAAEADLTLRAAAITAAADGIAITDASGIILDTNPAFARILGYSDGTRLAGHPWSQCFCSQTTRALERNALAALVTQTTWMGPALARRADGATVELELNLTRMPDGRVVWIARDVSARKALEREKLALRDAVNRAHRQEIINLVAAGLTHDLSNLTALISHLSDPDNRGFAADRPEVLGEIHMAARQMVSLLEPIRHLGRRPPDLAPADLGAVLTEAAGILQLGAPASVAVTVSLPDTPITTQLDSLQLMQVLLNLGLNARDALGPGVQRIALSLALADQLPAQATLETGQIPDAPFALFTIQDSGSGIPDDMRAKIWEPYFTTKTLTGTGLGLFVVADIVRTAGGAIALDTQAGGGTSFYIAWPLTKPRPGTDVDGQPQQA
ncbi:MAG: sensor kinase CckA [Pseudomonadota bacterium]